MIELLRLSHRIERDKRITTHVFLTARSLKIEKAFYSGQKDSNMERSLNKITESFGGPFEISYIKSPLTLIKEKKQQGYKIVHLTMYGMPFDQTKIDEKNILYIVGSEKVPPEIYQEADYNISVSQQPISEVSALGILLYKNHGFKQDFKDKKIEVMPKAKGKLLKTHKL